VLPFLIITYNRFDLVLEILKRLNEFNQRKVYIAIDDYYKRETEFRLIEQFLYDKEFQFRLFKWESNVGCEINVTESIKWFFENEENGIILEDDCIPERSLFDLIPAISCQNHLNTSISFFSTNTEPEKISDWYKSYLPMYWGWYTTRTMYQEFYTFLHRNSFNFSDFYVFLFKTNMSFRLKLIILCNYFSFDFNKKGVGWDSVLLIFCIIKSKPFLIPPVSYISNKGFGELNQNFTHTAEIPEWYNRILYSGANGAKGKFVDVNTDLGMNNSFLIQFFKSATNNSFKLLFSTVKYFLKFKARK